MRQMCRDGVRGHRDLNDRIRSRAGVMTNADLAGFGVNASASSQCERPAENTPTESLHERPPRCPSGEAFADLIKAFRIHTILLFLAYE